MGEERILAEIEQHLVQEDPALAQRLESFGQSPWRRAMTQEEYARLRRWGIIGMVALLVVLFITMIAAVAREPGKVGDYQPYRPPAGPAVVVPPAGESATPAPAGGQGRTG